MTNSLPPLQRSHPVGKESLFNSLRRNPSLSISVGLTRVLVQPESNWARAIILSLHPDEGTYNSTGIVTGILGRLPGGPSSVPLSLSVPGLGSLVRVPSPWSVICNPVSQVLGCLSFLGRRDVAAPSWCIYGTWPSQSPLCQLECTTLAGFVVLSVGQAGIKGFIV